MLFYILPFLLNPFLSFLNLIYFKEYKVQTEANQYLMGSPSACTTLCMESALLLLNNAPCTYNSLISIIKEGCDEDLKLIQQHKNVEDILKIRKYGTQLDVVRTIFGSIKDWNNLNHIIEEIFENKKENYCLIFIKSPETISICFRNQIIVFDSHTVGNGGAVFFIFQSIVKLIEYLKLRFLPIEIPIEDLEQDLRYHQFEITILKLKHIQCNICFNTMDWNKIIFLEKCHHYYCKNCLFTYIETNKKLPLRCPNGPPCEEEIREENFNVDDSFQILFKFIKQMDEQNKKII